MKALVEKIIQNSKQDQIPLKPLQLFYREFDAALRLASNNIDDPAFDWHLGHMESYGQEAGISAGEIAHRKNTLLWTLSRNNQLN